MSAPILSDAAMTRVQMHAQTVVREMTRLQGEADRMTRLCQNQQAELVNLRRKVRDVSVLKTWVNEDGKRFVFADDLAVALGIMSEVTP